MDQAIQRGFLVQAGLHSRNIRLSWAVNAGNFYLCKKSRNSLHLQAGYLISSITINPAILLPRIYTKPFLKGSINNNHQRIKS